MDGSQLLSNVSFDDARKGYDRDQVDTFLRGLSEKVGELQQMLRTATERAEASDARVAEAQRARAKAEADATAARLELDKAKAGGLDDEKEAAAFRDVLKLAQKTADAAIEEANTKAKGIVSDARAKSTVMIVDAEAEIERIKADARQRADALVDDKARALTAETDELTTRRASLAAEINALETSLGSRRTALADTVAELQRLLDGPALDVPDASVADTDTATDLGVDTADGVDTASDEAEPTERADVANLIEEPMDAPEPVVVEPHPADDAPADDEPTAAEPERSEPATPAIDLSANPLFAEPEAELDAGPATQPVDLFRNPEADHGPHTGATPVITFGAPAPTTAGTASTSPPGASVVTREELDLREKPGAADVDATASVFGDADSNAAMDAFFGQDFDTLATSAPKGRFLRR